MRTCVNELFKPHNNILCFLIVTNLDLYFLNTKDHVLTGCLVKQAEFNLLWRLMLIPDDLWSIIWHVVPYCFYSGMG